MKKINFTKAIEVVLAISLTMLPLAASALDLPGCTNFSGVNCTSANGGITGLLLYVINIMLALAGLVAVLFLIIGGFWYITSAGNEETAEKGKGTIINAIIGIVVIILSYVIVNVVSGLVTKPTSTIVP